jgi:DinB family protein
MCRGAGLHDHFGSRRERVDEPLELPSDEAFSLDDASRAIRERHFEHILCQIDRDRRSIHVGPEPKEDPGKVRSMRLDQRLQAFNEKRGALLDEMDALDPATLVARPLAGKWSILEIIEHLVLAERAVLQGLPEPSRLSERERRLKHRFFYPIVMFVLRYGISVQVPSPAMVPQGDCSLRELRSLWDENQRWLRTYIGCLDHNGLCRPVFEHPVAGPLSVKQAVRMDQVHLDSHVRQIRRLQRLLI